MKFEETKLRGAFLIDLERRNDERGFFARTFCQKEFAEHGLDPRIAQCNLSYNQIKGTLRGLHYQAAPSREAKLVTCVRGEVFDVIVDFRKSSPTYLHWWSTILSQDRRNSLYVPEAFAHGFLTLADDTEIFYQMSVPFDPASARGLRWNDPALAIKWPCDPLVISTRDLEHDLISTER